MSGRGRLSLWARIATRIWQAFGDDVSAVRCRIETAGITRSYILCAPPRSGSNFLAALIADTGLVGRAGEYFGEVFRRDVVPSLNRRAADDYLVACMDQARGTGVFGLKLHGYQLPVFLHLLRLRGGVRRLNDRELIDAVFPQPSFLHLRREDLVAQAVSWQKAVTSRKYKDNQWPTIEPTFDLDALDARVRRLQQQDEAWARWFAENGIEPLRFTYEDVVADPTGATRQALEFIGVDVPPDLSVEPRTKRQADAVNEAWIRRYKERGPLESP